MTIHSTFVNSVTTAHVLALKLLFGVDMCVTFFVQHSKQKFNQI